MMYSPPGLLHYLAHQCSSGGGALGDDLVNNGLVGLGDYSLSATVYICLN